jgi:colicin import membrane protein
VKLKIDKTLVASVALHVLVIGWGLVSFATKAFESIPEESVTVDVVSANTLSKAGMKNGNKAEPKPLVEKVAEARPVDDVAATAAAGRGQAGREKARSAEAGCREQAEGRAETGREEAGSAEDRSDRGSAEEGTEEAEAAGPDRRQAAGAGQAEARSCV